MDGRTMVDIRIETDDGELAGTVTVDWSYQPGGWHSPPDSNWDFVSSDLTIGDRDIEYDDLPRQLRGAVDEIIDDAVREEWS